MARELEMRRKSVPLRLAMQICATPLAVDEYTICFPSGVKSGVAFIDARWL